MNQEKITGIILSGGKSSRMGTDKGLVPFLGSPMVLYAINLLKPVCDDIIISANHNGYKRFGYPVQPDIISHCGPLGGIFSGLTVSSTLHNIILSCDMPLLTQGMIRLLLKYRSENTVTIPVHGAHQIEPLCGCYPNKFLDKIRELIENRQWALSDFLSHIPVHYIQTTDHPSIFFPGLFLNVNSPDDLSKAEALFRQYHQGNP